MYDCLNSPTPRGKEKHSGNKRKQLADMKVKARRAERKETNKPVVTRAYNGLYPPREDIG